MISTSSSTIFLLLIGDGVEFFPTGLLGVEVLPASRIGFGLGSSQDSDSCKL